MFDFLSASQGVTIGVNMIVFNIAMSFILSLIISLIYQKTHKGLSYSQTFVISLVILCTLSSVIMMVIGNVLIIAVALLGAFTIIRFRTAIKDPKDVSFILFSLIVGMAVGTGSYDIGIIATIMISLIVYFLDKINFGSITKHDYVLTFSLNKEKAHSDVYESVFKKYLKFNDLLNINTQQEGEIMDFTFNIKFLSNVKMDDFIKELSSLDYLNNVDLIATKNDIEY
ncbi:DUF4956 domain-containing protein [Patescibacteria group bacterium]|nr:DUF4956 domain-containing protein [Patescibacteria group bacterium]